MKVLLASGHRYPADDRRSAGTRPRAEPSGAPGAVHDLLARGLAELGHQVLYLLPEPPAEPLPPGVRWVDAPDPAAEVWHGIASESVPWVATCHGRWIGHRGGRRWIYVSRSLARWFGSERFVYNGLDPADFVYRETKGDYLLFLGSLERRLDKGLDVALAVAAAAGLPLKVAGAACDRAIIEETAAECAAHGAELVGDVRGAVKAELLAGARALVFPSRVAEGFGLAIAEALMSGTPVVTGDRGACPELVAPEVGFCCRDEREWLEALGRLGEIDPAACRARALAEHHYRVMAARYVAEYERELAARPRRTRPAGIEPGAETAAQTAGDPVARSQWPPAVGEVAGTGASLAGAAGDGAAPRSEPEAALLAVYRDPGCSFETRSAAARGLGRLERPGAATLEALTAGAGDAAGQPGFRVASAAALLAAGRRRAAARSFAALLADPALPCWLRPAAGSGLAGAGERAAAAEALAAAARDPAADVWSRRAAAAALLRCEDTEPLPEPPPKGRRAAPPREAAAPPGRR